jgi:hypothetical protein
MSEEPLLVFDLGAHLGADTSYYLARGFRVLALEANPDLARRLSTLGSGERLAVEAPLCRWTPGRSRCTCR